jgi:DnaJ-class molecular chaperone
MTDYYQKLGLGRAASLDEIKKAYRSLAMKHHPDRGGDEKKFKEISEAYEILSDPEKKSMVDSGIDPAAANNGHNKPGGSPFDFHFNSGNFEDVFSQFGFHFNNRQVRRNKSININVELTLEDVLNGKEIDADIALPGQSNKTININIPPGIDDGQQVRYQGLGDSSVPNAPPGDLFVSVRVRQHPIFQRHGDSLAVEKIISVWDAILGVNLKIDTIDGKNLQITVPPGTAPETVLSCKGEGMPNLRSKKRGNLLIKIKIDIPKNLTLDQKQLIEKIKNAI